MSKPLKSAVPIDKELLNQRIIDALYASPNYFESDSVLRGIDAIDLHSLNSLLGAAIESQIGRALNRMREFWDPNREYTEYSFVRQPQNFPDLVLGAYKSGGFDRIMGIEVKSWYILAKEREPSFRFKATPAVCGTEDLFVVVPWALDTVLSGSPIIFTPWVEQLKYVAEYRNWYRTNRLDLSAVIISKATGRFPKRGDEINDEPSGDKGGNFGRIARTGIMDEYKKEIFEHSSMLGVSSSQWQRLLKDLGEKNKK